MRLLNDLINSLNDLEEVKRFKRLEKIISEDKGCFAKLKKLYEYQKQIINSKHYGLDENFKLFNDKYNELKKEIEENIIVELYMDSLNDMNELLDIITSIIKDKIDSKLI